MNLFTMDGGGLPIHGLVHDTAHLPEPPAGACSAALSGRGQLAGTWNQERDFDLSVCHDMAFRFEPH